MGVVYKAVQGRLQRVVALKVIRHGQFASAEEVRRFQTEAKALASLDHPNVVPIYEIGEHDGWHYFAMKFIEGDPLARLVPRLAGQPRAVATIVSAVARGVHHAHQRGILHRDLKPSNILLDRGGEPQVTDFGLAKLIKSSPGTTLSGQVVGTPSYMAPEQAAGKNKFLTTACDVYGLGAVLYELLTCRPPFRGESALETLRQVIEQEPVRPRAINHKVNRDLEAVCLRCLERDPRRRYGSAEALADDLDHWLKGEPIAARSMGGVERAARWVKRRPFAALGFATAVLLLVVGGIYLNSGQQTRVAEAALIGQLLESDRVNASLVANGLERDLVARQKVLERFAADPQLRVATAQADREKLKRLMQEFNRREAAPVLGWIVTDARGNLLATDLNVKLPDSFPVPRNFAWRDWFNGKGDDFGPDKGKREYAPIRATHFSQPFVRRLVPEPELGIGISTPVFAPGKQGEVVGVLYTPVRLHDIDSWLDGVNIKDGYVVLVDSRGYCLRHPDRQRILPVPDENPRRWESPAFQAALTREGSTAEHLDPIDHRLYLASYAPLPRVGWGALVQHERTAALRPIDDLKWQRDSLVAILVGGVVLLTGGLVGRLLWKPRRRFRAVGG
jgi:hypothetical protein